MASFIGLFCGAVSRAQRRQMRNKGNKNYLARDTADGEFKAAGSSNHNADPRLGSRQKQVPLLTDCRLATPELPAWCAGYQGAGGSHE
jgi:ribosome assembly protein YihI (activator of Der GTPase)